VLAGLEWGPQSIHAVRDQKIKYKKIKLKKLNKRTWKGRVEERKEWGIGSGENKRARERELGSEKEAEDVRKDTSFAVNFAISPHSTLYGLQKRVLAKTHAHLGLFFLCRICWGLC
jgi:hypothetical protein